MIAIIDYGVGNLFSLSRSLEYLGIESTITNDLEQLKAADQIILPGVGAFGDAIQKLREHQLEEPIKQLVKDGKPLMGICLGMQLLFEKSTEFGEHRGLGLLSGEIVSLKEMLQDKNLTLKVPHIGWNELLVKKESVLLKNFSVGEQVYYVHSFYATNCDDSLVATSEYGIEVPGLVQKGNVYGAQFHPEKSGTVGLQMLKAFSEVKE
ncbi:imidazole glycerol phosphate synthase, glutamine amidotransferase subunit [Enterococcus sp. DIV2402]|uniref:Imidazole glycerol phosphate synthase subunit HisH n=1 Tax=Candidatus Enterococcus lowellii TaxID=2230877 RepID=A0ABZ2SLT0_9ENTE|nr:imidazole glycerol phosphate synthase subunit HisH [Enterococcus sp. DIV2402]MBO0464390.1 imidazole glycerol phosphate synthase subunit HisH [Enterococcus sp. DIV2402]